MVIGHSGVTLNSISITFYVLLPTVSNYSRTVRLGSRNGLANGLELLLDAEVYDYGSSKFGTEGFVLSILHHLDIPIMKNTGLTILPGQSSQMAVSAEIMFTDRKIRNRFTPSESQCYFEGEVNLKHLPPENSFR